MKKTLLTLSALLTLSMLNGCGDGGGGFSPSTPGVRATVISAGDGHSCEVISDGSARCWGLNTSGQVGNGTFFSVLKPAAVTGVSGAGRVSAGGAHSCAVLGGSVWCWGENTSGQLGNSTTATSSTPVAVTGVTAATDVSAGGDHSCALLSGGRVFCWGKNIFGQLGNGATSSSSSPVAVSGISSATEVSAGGNHTCALLSDSTIRCWGINTFGQLGNGSISSSSSPVAVSGITNATHISAGANHTCATVSTGAIQCWGDNSSGQLGAFWTLISLIPLVNITASSTPVQVASVNTSANVSAGFQHTCAVLTGGTVRCWGENASGQLGNGGVTAGFTPPGVGASPTSTISPVTVSGISTATAADAGLFHSCALLTNRTVRCWGVNSSGQLGNDTGFSSALPVEVAN